MGVKLSTERTRALITVPRKRQELADEFTEMSPTEIAELFAQLTERERVLAFRLLPRNRAADVFVKLPYQQQVPLLKNLSRRHQAEILNEMPSNELLPMLSKKDEPHAKGIKKTN